MNLDPAIKNLVEALNSHEEISTNSSCEGHENPTGSQAPLGTFYVDFDIEPTKDGWHALSFIVKRIAMWDCDASMEPWIDGGLRWDFRGTYTDKSQLDQLAKLITIEDDNVIALKKAEARIKELEEQINSHFGSDPNETTYYDADAEHFVTCRNLGDSRHSES